MTDDLSFGDIRCEHDRDMLSIRPTLVWTGRMLFFVLCGIVIFVGLGAGCAVAFDNYRAEGGWSMWLAIAGAILFALLALACVAGIWGIMRMSRPLVFDRVGDTINRGNDHPGKMSDIAYVSVEKVNEEDDVVIHFKDPNQKQYSTQLANMSGGADSRVAILVAKFARVKATGFQGSVLYDPAAHVHH